MAERKAERDLSKLPFNPNNLSKTVDEPTFLKLKNVNLDGDWLPSAGFKTYSQFEAAQGFIGIAFRVNDDNTAFESIYLRPEGQKTNWHETTLFNIMFIQITT